MAFRCLAANNKYNVDEHMGRNYFMCSGGMVLGPEYWKATGTFLMITIPSAVHFTMVVPYFMDTEEWNSVALPIASVLFVGIILWCLVAVCSKDPGIIPRSAHPPDDLFDPNDPIPDRVRTKQTLVNDQPVNLKYCETCMIWRPPRASHCTICDNCVERFDHHCPFLGTCIGKRNYSAFYAFVFCTSLYALFVCLAGIGRIVNQASELNFYFSDGMTVFKYMVTRTVAIPVAILSGYCFLVFGFTGGLTAFHTHLLITNKTTKEACTNSWGMVGSPYAKNGCVGCCGTLCGTKAPSKIRLKYNGEDDEIFEEIQVHKVDV